MKPNLLLSYLQHFLKQHLGIIQPVVITSDVDPVYSGIARQDVETQAGVKSNGAGIDRRCTGGDDVPPMGAADLEEQIEQMGAKADMTVSGVDAGKMDVAVVRFGLGEKSDEKTHQVFLVQGHEGRIVEVIEEQPGQRIGQVPAAPPVIDYGDDVGVILRLAVSDV